MVRLLSFIVFFELILLMGCTSAPQLNSQKLSDLGITNRDIAPNFAYEKFYKTSGLESFEFSPDNQIVYFVKSDGKVNNVFKYVVKSKKIVPITAYPEPVASFLVDPKGRYLYIQKDRGGNEIYDLFRFNLHTEKTTRLTNGKNVERSYFCDISKDGRSLYFSQSRKKRAVYDIKKLNTKTQKISVLKKGGEEQLFCDKLNPGGTLLSFANFVGNNESHLGVVELKTNKSWYVLHEKGVKSYDSFFSGRNLYFLSTKDSDNTRLWKAELNTKKLSLAKIDLDNNLQSIGIFSNSKTSSILYRGKLKPEVRTYSGIFEKKLENFQPQLIEIFPV